MLKLIVNQECKEEPAEKRAQDAATADKREESGPALRLIAGGGRAVRNPSDHPAEDLAQDHSG